MKRVYIRDKKRLASEFQFFMHDFVDACKAFGIPRRADIFLGISSMSVHC